jgi:hypothetical protein
MIFKRWWKKKEVVLSPFVQALVDKIRDNPGRFNIDYCRRDDHSTLIQLRDKELGLTEGAWIYIETLAWYNDCYIGEAKVADNLARSLSKDEVYAIYKTVFAHKVLKRYEERESLLEKALGRYVE